MSIDRSSWPHMRLQRRQWVLFLRPRSFLTLPHKLSSWPLDSGSWPSTGIARKNSVQRSTKLWRRSMREATLISPPKTSRVCHTWWLLQRFAGIAFLWPKRWQSSSDLLTGKFEASPHRCRNSSRAYRRRCPASHETDCGEFREVVYGITHPQRNCYLYLDDWVQPVHLFQPPPPPR